MILFLGLGLGFDDSLGLWHCCVSLGFDHKFLYVDMSQNQVQLNKKEGDEKKNEKLPMTWHGITCDGSVKKKNSKVLVYNQSRLRRSGEIDDS